VRLLADCRSHAVGPVRDLRAQIRNRRLILQREREVRAIGRHDARTGHLHAWALDEAVVDGVSEIDRAVPAAVRHQIDNGRETGGQIALCIYQCNELAVLKPQCVRGSRARCARSDAGPAWCSQRIAVHHMEMCVDQPRQHRRTTEIDHARAGGNLYVRPDVGDPIAADDNHLVRLHRARARVEHASGADRDGLRR
jgi:hypothetical protein